MNIRFDDVTTLHISYTNNTSYLIKISGAFYINMSGKTGSDAVILFKYTREPKKAPKLEYLPGSKVYGRDSEDNKQIALEIKSKAEEFISSRIKGILNEIK